MNRIVLIGNGFDLAHNLKTSYQDFINWYWEKRVTEFVSIRSSVAADILCSFKTKESIWSILAFTTFSRVASKRPGYEIVNEIISNKDAFEVKFSIFFKNILNSIVTKGWVDIENEYYHLLKHYSSNNQDGVAHSLNQELKTLQK